MTNILVTVTAPDTGKRDLALDTYRVDGYAGSMLPARMPVNVGHYEDTFRKAGDDGLLARRVTFLLFGSKTERLPPPTSAPGP